MFFKEPISVHERQHRLNFSHLKNTDAGLSSVRSLIFPSALTFLFICTKRNMAGNNYFDKISFQLKIFSSTHCLHDDIRT